MCKYYMKGELIMTNTMLLNGLSFVELDQGELMCIDGGWTAKQWIVGICTVAGAVIGTAVGGPIGTAIGVKAGTLAAVVVTAGVGLVCACIANRTATALTKDM
jgi:hypothetical protein